MDDPFDKQIPVRYRRSSSTNQDGRISNGGRFRHNSTASQRSTDTTSRDMSPTRPFFLGRDEETRRPLVDYCTNEWKTNPNFLSSISPDHGMEPDEVLARFIAFICSPRVRRTVLRAIIFLILVIAVVLVDHNVPQLGPRRRAERELLISLTGRGKNAAGGWFGNNMRPSFPDVVQVMKLDSNLLPREHPTAHLQNQKRLIFVGDVHGCKAELMALLDVVSFDASKDHLIFVGDLITKGPDSPGVVDVAQRLGASCVRGNHEDRILLVQRELTASHLQVPGAYSQSDMQNQTDPMDEPLYASSDATDIRLARSFSPRQLEYLKSCPVILQVGKIVSHLEVVVAHAGLVPGIPLEDQDPISVMSMRTIDLKTHVPSRKSNGGVRWTRLWDKYQHLLDRHSLPPGEGVDHTLVVYGHNSGAGLQIQSQYTKGIDTGCYKGGQLTALIIGDGGAINYNHVACKDYRPRTRPEKVQLSDILNEGKEDAAQ